MAMKQFLRSLIIAAKAGQFETKTFNCPPMESTDMQTSTTDSSPNAFERMLRTDIVPDARVMTLRNDYSVEFVFNVSVVGEQDALMGLVSAQANTSPMEIASIANDYKVMKIENTTLRPLRRYFRIGVAEVSVAFVDIANCQLPHAEYIVVKGLPWSYIKRDTKTNKPLLDDNGNMIWEGYCIDFADKLAQKLDFDYVLVPPKSGSFGERVTNIRWDGLVGDLMTGVSLSFTTNIYV